MRLQVQIISNPKASISVPGKIRLGISACLLGEKVRYDGRHKLDRYLTDTLGRYIEWVSVCPETGMGLPVPREPMRLTGDPGSPRLVTVKSGIDHTDRMLSWAGTQMQKLMDIQGFIFKSRSPSCGLKDVEVYSESGIISRTGVGIFAHEFMKQFPHLPVEDNDSLLDPSLLENFIERTFVYRR